MQDGIIKGTGNSRYLKSISNFLTQYPTYQDFVAALVAGTLPIDLNGINETGWDQLGTALNKANLLSDETAGLLGLPDTAVPDDAFKTLNSAFNSMALKTTLLNSWISDGSTLVIPVDGGALTSGRYLLKIESSGSGLLNLSADRVNFLSAVQLEAGSTTPAAQQDSAHASIRPDNPAVIELVYSKSDLSAFYITPGVLYLLRASNATQIQLTSFTAGTKFYLYKEE